MAEDKYLLPNWEIDEKLTYQVTKIETFNYSGKNSPPFERSFPLELTLMEDNIICLLYTSPSPRDATLSRMPSSA